MVVGVLALQGGFHAHRQVLDELGVASREVRLAEDLDGLDALILPGGESTTMLKLMEAFDLFEPIDAFARLGAPILGTCAGAILMASRVSHPRQPSFGWIPAGIERNAYGTQQDSFQTEIAIPRWDLTALPVLFIRAPRFVDPDPGCAVLSTFEGRVTGLSYRHFTAVTYHPELGGTTRFHQAWLARSLAKVAAG